MEPIKDLGLVMVGCCMAASCFDPPAPISYPDMPKSYGRMKGRTITADDWRAKQKRIARRRNRKGYA